MVLAKCTRCLALVVVVLVGVAAPVVFSVTDGLLPNGNFEHGPDKSQLNRTGRSLGSWSTSGPGTRSRT
uniref:OSJNBb0091E11.20 protein n=1 Tax=Oryza sativa subsp. japonica TaxID=39947 RepID=Q7XU57_ORYSJ|nr:OSJNBb0091E11.20 [Oryza sativa Japonica Group]